MEVRNAGRLVDSPHAWAVLMLPERDVSHECNVAVAVDGLPIASHHRTPIHILQSCPSQFHYRMHNPHSLTGSIGW